MPRNRELMRVFKDVGLVEQLGSGMSRILKVYDKSIFHISEHFIKVEIPFSTEQKRIPISLPMAMMLAMILAMKSRKKWKLWRS